MSVLKRYLKLVLLTSTVPAVLLGALLVIFLLMSGHALEESVDVGVKLGLFAGALCALFAVPLFAVSDFLGSKLDPWSAISQSRHFELRADIETARRACLESLKGLGRNFEILKDDRRTGKILVRTAMSWKSWGERIAFKLTPAGSRVVEVQVVSRPVLITTTADWGVNAANIEAIAPTLARFKPT